MNHQSKHIYRILDSNSNRASEGIRSIEEYVRFELNDESLSQSTKRLRHDLTAALSHLSRAELLEARDSTADVGRGIQTEQEYQRLSSADVVAAAAQRVQQSLRVLEEYGKTVNVEFAREIESVRYQSYSLMRDIELRSIQMPRMQRLSSATLYFLLDCMHTEDQFVSRIRSLCAAGVDVFQLRDKTATDRQLYSRGLVGARVAAESGALFVINDRADLAVASEADGVHLGQDELPVAEARRLLGSQKLIGVSTHSMDQVHRAIEQGADYLGCGPTFESQTKSFNAFPGLAFLRDVHNETTDQPRPAFAIGGVTLENVDQVTRCGFHRIAVTAAISNAAAPEAAARELKVKLSRTNSIR